MLTYLAPMEGVTDYIFRQVVAKASSPDYFVTEFTNADGWYAVGSAAISNRLVLTNEEKEKKNVIAQIWGKSLTAYEKISYYCAELGFCGIDINTGCPDKTVIKNGAGSALIDQNELVHNLIKSCKKSGLPVSVKTRLGILTPQIDTWIKFLFEQQLHSITLHLRTRKEMSKVPAHYEFIPKLIEIKNKISPETKLIINGDIHNIEHGQELKNSFGNFDGVMIGRGVFNNIFAFSKQEIKDMQKVRFDLFFYHINLLEENNTEHFSYNNFKKFFKIYVKGYRGANEHRINLMDTQNLGELKEKLKKIYNL